MLDLNLFSIVNAGQSNLVIIDEVGVQLIIDSWYFENKMLTLFCWNGSFWLECFFCCILLRRFLSVFSHRQNGQVKTAKSTSFTFQIKTAYMWSMWTVSSKYILLSNNKTKKPSRYWPSFIVIEWTKWSPKCSKKFYCFHSWWPI